MLFDKLKRPARDKAAPAPKIYSVAASLKARRFDGVFEVSGSAYRFAYAPARAALAGGKLELRGRLTITDERGRARSRENVRAVLIGTQGGIGTAPARRQVASGVVQTGSHATSGQQQAIAGGSVGAEARPPGGARADQPAAARADALPEVDSTGDLSFCGVMYFRLDPLDGRGLGVAADLSRVQMNARLAPSDEAGRDLHAAYSALVGSLGGARRDLRAAAALLTELNKTLASK